MDDSANPSGMHESGVHPFDSSPTRNAAPSSGRASRLAPPPAAPPPVPPKKNGCQTVLLVLGIMLFMGVVSVGGLVLLSVFTGMMHVGSRGHGRIKETVLVPGEEGHGTIAVISIQGAIFGTGSVSSPSDMVRMHIEQLRRAADDGDVRAVVIQMDSPGGGLTASDMLYREVQRLKAKGKPVVVSVGSLAASGGYYVIAPADHIVANPTSLVGSFGVIMQHMDVSGLMEKIGIGVEPIQSGESKDIGSPFRHMTPEEKAYFESLLASFHDRFVGIIAEGRGLGVEAVKALADGKVYLPDEALRHGLVDEIGYFDDALQKARTLGKTKNPRVVSYSRFNVFEELFGMEARGTPLERLARQAAGDGVMRGVSVDAIYTGRFLTE